MLQGFGAQDTIEQQIVRLAEKKRSLAGAGGSAGAGGETMKNAEVEEIFGL